MTKKEYSLPLIDPAYIIWLESAVCKTASYKAFTIANIIRHLKSEEFSPTQLKQLAITNKKCKRNRIIGACTFFLIAVASCILICFSLRSDHGQALYMSLIINLSIIAFCIYLFVTILVITFKICGNIDVAIFELLPARELLSLKE